MNRNHVLFFLFFIPILSAFLRAQEPTASTLNIDSEAEYQKIVGFGGSMGWIHPHADDKEKVYDLLFKELGVSLLRLRALGAEEGDEYSLEIKNDNDDPGKFNWEGFPLKKTEAKQAEHILGARKRGVETFIPVTWSPPAWMKDKGKRAGGGVLEHGLEAELAELWAAYVVGMKKSFGIDINYLSIQNEPDLAYYYPTCRYTDGRYAEVWKLVQDRMKTEKLNVKVLGPDTCRMYNLERYLEPMIKKGYPEDYPILTHMYDLSIDFGEIEKDPERWEKANALAEKYKRPLWLMETANYLSFDVKQGSYLEALIWAQKIHYALTIGNCEVVCYWALFFDKRGEAFIYCPKNGSRDWEITPKYYTSMNYYRFVRPGMIRCSVEASDKEILASSFTSDKELVSVLINPTGKKKTLAISGDPGMWSAYQTTQSLKCESIEIQGKTLQLPSKSVTTLIQKRQVGEDKPKTD